MSLEIVEWSTPDCCANWRWDIFLALSWALSHSLNARSLCPVIRQPGSPVRVHSAPILELSESEAKG